MASQTLVCLSPIFSHLLHYTHLSCCLMSIKREEQMRKDMDRQDRERKKEEERLMRERLREEERYQREQKRELERREIYA